METVVPLRLLPHRIAFTPRTGVGAYGPVYGPQVAGVPARVEPGVKLVRDEKGVEVVSSGRIFFQPAKAPQVGALVTLPSGEDREVLVREEHSGRVAAIALVTVHYA